MTLQKLTAVDLENRVVERTKQLQETVAELRVKNNEKEVLLREVYHRVKNNLQVVQSLLKMRARSLRSVEAKRAIETSVERIHVMAMAHERLYNMPDVTSLPLSTYLNDVIAGAIKANSDQPDTIDFELDCRGDIPHASPGDSIRVDGKRARDQLPEAWNPQRSAGQNRCLHPAGSWGGSDDCEGQRSRSSGHFDLAKCTSMGLKLAASLAHQLGGHLKFTSDNGCQVQADLTRLGQKVEQRKETAFGAV